MVITILYASYRKIRGRIAYEVYSNESVENNPQSSGVQEVNREEVSSDVYSHQRAVRIGRENGYVFVTRRSRRKGDDSTEPFIKVWLVCDRHGERASTATVRRAGSKKIGCPFKLEGEYQENTGDWKLTVKDDSHNHDPSQHLEILENLLSSKKYVYYTREDPATNIVEEIFFVHPKSFEMWRTFPHVLMIDATYKTNMYRLPFVQVVGVTSTHQSFCIAHAFISKEREENFVWVLLQIKAMLQKCMEPRVIVTDRDKALMNACDKIFPDCSKNLCRWHIHENIAKHCRASFTDEDWANFKYSWSVLCESPTPDIYQYNFNRLYERLSCGLPCACRLASIEATGGRIPLDALDVFWRKLDLKPSFVDDENVDVDKVLGQVRNKIISEPNQVKRSMLSRITGVVFPSKSNKKAPVVQKDTRGRPTLKKQQQRKQDVARNSSFTGSQQSKCDPTRHSSCIASQDSIQASSVIQHRRPTKGKGKQPQDDNAYLGFPLIMGKDAVNNINCFKDSIPSVFHPYISQIQDVNPDGNCGFRSVALGLGLNENRWLFIRQQLLQEMDNKEEWWRTVFDRVAFQEYDMLRHTIDWQDVKAAPVSRWMSMPYTGLLIAQRFGVIVHLLSIAGNQTFFPLWFGPNVHAQHQTVSLVHVNRAHFIHVKLDGDFPIPTPNAL
ncbi:hypothetical protein L1987_22313 [Smallanthus sonchifolius]|uniref:Uncharacterized protein n=1 Tax=Smallanthus sonchifolius TaxID=185202 RepID=A0ACB9IDS9_9ASTR|nr:hypothetical protein L1987_22313 [Smallanthus sonchifolius]